MLLSFKTLSITIVTITNNLRIFMLNIMTLNKPTFNINDIQQNDTETSDILFIDTTATEIMVY
jgi:hypothetical protein